MAATYHSVGWTPHKKRYDLFALGGVVIYLAIFVIGTFVMQPEATAETTIIRAFGTCAFLLLHIVLSIGPLARLDTRFLPLLYNRRHLGVMTFFVGLVHGLFAIVQFHVGGVVNPLVSVFTSNMSYGSIANFPFQVLGFAALMILFVMAATSHDFWLANLTPPVWKALHMLVYVAYGLLVAHVSLGVLQDARSSVPAMLVGAGVIWVGALHVAAANRRDDVVGSDAADGFVSVVDVDAIEDGRARIVAIGDQRIAIFRYNGKISAVSNACAHQNGPLGEGRIIDGCVTCPWHGFQYRPECGRAPEPFTERIPTFAVRVEQGRVFVDPRPNPAGTDVPPATISGGQA